MLRLKPLPLLITVLAVLFYWGGSAHAATITSTATGNWSGATTSAWPITTRTGTITSATNTTAVTGVSTLFTTELTVGNVISTGTTVIGTISTITDNTHLTLLLNAAKAVTALTYASNGVGPVDNVTIKSGNVVTMDVAFATVTVLTINNAGATTSLTISGSNSLTMLSSATCAAPSATGASTIAIGAGTFVSRATMLINGGTTGTRTCAVTLGAGTLTLGNGLTFGGTPADASFSTTAGTINLVGTISGVAGTFSINSGTTLVSTATAAIGGAYTLGIVSVPNGTLSLGGFAITIASNTNISGGTLNVSNATGAKAFTGFVNVTSGIFDLSAFTTAHSFGGGINMNGTTFNTGAGATTFSASQSLTGANNMTFGGAPTVSGGFTVTNNNTGTVTVAGTLTLTGNWTQGVNATLLLTAAGGATGTGTMTATANPNTVTYTGNGAAVKAGSYYDLNTQPSGATQQVISAGTLSVSDNWTMGDGTNTGAKASTNNPVINLTGADLVISANATYTKGTGATTFNGGTTQNWTDNTAAGQDLGVVFITVNGTNNTTVNLGSSVKATDLTINTNQTLSLNGSNTLTLSSATNAGNLTGSSGMIILSFAGTAFTNTGTFTYNTSTIRYTGSAATITGLSGSGGTNGYYNLQLESGNAAQTLGVGPFQVNNNLIVGDGTHAGATAATNNSTMTVTGTMTIAAGATYAMGAAPLSVTSTTLLTGAITFPAGTGAMTFGDDLTVNGTLSGAGINTITANGDVIGTGTISLTGATQTFEQRVSASQNFGPTGSNSWAFKSLIFSNGSSSPQKVTTETSGSGGITVGITLTLGRGTDTSGATTTLDPGDVTWTLSGAGTVYTETANFGILCPNSLCPTNTSVFKYTGTTATTLGSTTGYYDLQIVPQALGAAVAYTGGGQVTVGDSFTLNPQAAANGNRLLTLTLGGNLTVGNLLTLEGTTGACSAINTSGTSYTITGSSIVILAGVGNCTDNLIVNGSTVTLSATGTPLTLGVALSSITYNTGTVRFIGNGATITPLSGTTGSNGYYSLELKPSGASQQVIGAGTLAVNGNLTIGDVTNTGATASGNPTINLFGNLTIAANAVYTKGTGTTTFKHGAAQTWTDNTTTQQDLGTVAIAVNTTNTTVTLGSSVQATDLVINPAQVLSLGGSNTLFLSTLSSSGTLTGSSGIIQLSATAGTPFFNSGTFTYNTSTVQYIGSGAKVTALAGAAGTNGYYNLQLEPNGASPQIISTTTLQTVRVNNDLTIGDGTNAGATASANNPAVTVSGDVNIAANATLIPPGSSLLSVGGSWNNSGTFTANTSTVAFTSTTPGQTITSNGSAFNNLWFDGGASGVWTLQDPLTVISTMTITAGTLDASTNCSGVGCAISVGGNWTNPVGGGGVFTARTGTVMFTTPAAGSQTITTDGNPFYNVQFNGTGGYWTLLSSLTVLSDLTITKGWMDTKSGTNQPILLGGDWTVTGGTFTINLSTLTFIGSAAQTINNSGEGFWMLIDSNTSPGGVTFASSFTATSLTINAAALPADTTVYFNAGSTFTVTTLKLIGSAANGIWIRPTPPNQYWNLKNISTNTVSYVDVAYSSASTNGGVVIVAGPNSTDSQNNTNWTFKIISVTLAPTTYDFTAVNLGASTQSVSAIGVTNGGNATETYALSVATTGATTWGVAIATPTALDTFVMEGLFNTTQPAKASFFNVDVITSTPTASTAGIYHGTQSGVSAAVGSVKNLWLYLFMPSSTTVLSQQSMNLTVSASMP